MVESCLKDASSSNTTMLPVSAAFFLSWDRYIASNDFVLEDLHSLRLSWVFEQKNSFHQESFGHVVDRNLLKIHFQLFAQSLLMSKCRTYNHTQLAHYPLYLPIRSFAYSSKKLAFLFDAPLKDYHIHVFHN